VPHGYLSEGEGCNDEEEQVAPEMQKARQLAKVRAWDAEHEGSKCTSLKPVTIGCCWAADKIPEHLMAKLVEFQVGCVVCAWS
jgi:hypothetical protein